LNRASGDLVLLDAHRGGDPAATEALLEQYRQPLWGFLVNHLPVREDAEDLFQEIGLKVMRASNTIRDGERFRSWLFSVAHNAVRSHYRKKRPVEDEDRLAREPAPPGQGQQASLERGERAAALRRCLTRLPERDREILLLDTMAELPQVEIARQFALNLNTVKTILRRTRIKLARMMVEAGHG